MSRRGSTAPTGRARAGSPWPACSTWTCPTPTTPGSSPAAALVRMCRSFQAAGGRAGHRRRDGQARRRLRHPGPLEPALGHRQPGRGPVLGRSGTWRQQQARRHPGRICFRSVTRSRPRTGSTRPTRPSATRWVTPSGSSTRRACRWTPRPAAIQFVTYHGRRLPIPGGPGDTDGIYNVIDEGTEPGDSATAPDFGSSFIQVVTWTRAACPVGRDDPHLLRVVQPRVPALRRPDRAVQPQAVAARPVLPGADQGRPEPDRHDRPKLARPLDATTQPHHPATSSERSR